jgi:hypothetical protein
MKDIYFYLLLGVFLYFIFTRVLERFTLDYNLKQENFDPSLVPVSSIVTLAKVAQKLVNGNGTLTNPGNLQIGANTATPGNLTVTGNTTVDGVLNLRAASSNSNGQISDKDGVSRLLFWDPDKNTYYDSGSGNVHHFRGHKGAEGTNVNVHGNLIATGNVSVTAGSGNNGVSITSGNPFVAFNKTGSPGAPQLYSDGTILHAYNAPFQVDQNLTVGGTLGVTGNTTVGGTLGVTGNTTVGGTLGVTGNTTVGGTLGVTGNTTVSGTLGVTGNTTVTGNICIGSTCINETHLKALKGETWFQLINKRSRQQLLDESGDVRARVSGDRVNSIQSKWRFVKIGETADTQDAISTTTIPLI